MAFLDNHPAIRRVGQFFLSYARKATTGSGLAATALATAIANLPTNSPDAIVAWLGSLPWWVSFIVGFIIFFVPIYLPPNGSRPQ